jgi:hypothetical protein
MCIVLDEVECSVRMCRQEKFQSVPYGDELQTRDVQAQFITKAAAFVVCRVCNLHHLGTPEALHETLMDRNRLVFTCMFSHLRN